MRISVVLLLAGLFVAAAATPLRAQSLADVARKEEERRRDVGESGKVYTNKDLRPVPPAPAPPASSQADAARTDSPSAGADAVHQDALSQDASRQDAARPDADRATTATGDPIEGATKDRAYWSRRMQQQRDQLERDRTLGDALQTRVNALTTDFVNRDDPAARTQIGNDRQKALTELERLKKAVVDDEKAMAALEEEARRAGVPPGWLR